MGNKSVQVDDAAIDRFAEAASRLQFIHRTKAIERAMREACQPTLRAAQRLIPLRKKPKGRNQEAHLQRAVAIKSIVYDHAAVAIFGWDYRKAPHGHLVEDGHDEVRGGKKGKGGKVIGHTKGKRYFEKAIAETESQIEPRLLQGIEEAFNKIMEGGSA